MKKFLINTLAVSFTFWNILFLGAVYIGILPFIGVPLLMAVFNGEIEPEFAIALCGFIATPTLCTYIGYRHFYRQPAKLARLFYGVEAPLVLLYVVRLFVLRELTAATHLVLDSLFIAILALLAELFAGYNSQTKVLSWLQAFCHSLMLIFGIYFSLILLFDAIPIAVYILRFFFSFQWLPGLVFLIHPVAFLLSLVFLGLFFLSATLFVVMPFAVAIFYFDSAKNILQAFGKQYSKTRALQVLLSITTAWIILFISFTQQPQATAFAALKEPINSLESRATLVSESSAEIRKGLLNAYLHPYRYLSSVKDSNRIRINYHYSLGIPEKFTQQIQNAYNGLIAPFLYQGNPKDDVLAAKLYAQFFDIPIQKGEKEAVRHALKSTAILDDAKAGVLNIDQKKVLLEEQHLNLIEHDAWADVELHEVYQNQTYDVEEIFYYFSLPENAVITGVWLGDNDNLNTRFPFKVATRGAAQKVYNSQVRRVRPVDPALLEQVGSRQYRLRAFPVPAKLRTTEIGNPQNRPTKMHLWLTYKVMQQDGKWALPQLEEKRNIYWTKSTKRFRNEKKIRGFADWLETDLPVSSVKQDSVKDSVEKNVTQAFLLDNYLVSVQKNTASEIKLPKDKQLAVILDTSYSMREQITQLTKNLTWLQDNLVKQNQVDFYLIYHQGITPKKIKLTEWLQQQKFPDNSNLSKLFYGSLQPKEMLQQFDTLKGNTQYDGVILLTDEGSYELGKDKQQLNDLNAPLWIVHLNSLAQAYDDATFKTIEKYGGGVTTEIAEALQQIAITNQTDSDVVRITDGYTWKITQNSSTTTSQIDNNNFFPLAARVLVRELSKQIVDNNLTQLDTIHAIAKQYSIVTPYSSMIVLVNDEQRKALQEAEAQADRFEREIENGQENLNKPNNPLNNTSTSIPESNNVIGLLAIAILMILIQKINLKRKASNKN
jgi:putative PEP-CTERM system integral membrane protein